MSISLIQGYLDEILTPAEESQLNEWIKADPDHAMIFAEYAVIHDRLKNHFIARAIKEDVTPSKVRIPHVSSVSQRISKHIGLLAASILILVGFGWWLFPNGLVAANELNRLIDVANNPGDRTYRITNLDPNPEQTEPRRPPIDGAILHVRHPDQYVLIRKFPDGRQLITGSDGEHGWSIQPEGPVRVSPDPMRFRGPVPGHQQGIPFANLRSDLLQLQDAYDVTFIPGTVNGLSGLQAEKKSAVHRGPRSVELWYQPKTGIIQRMVFDGMPRARGGPDRVAVELIGPEMLPSDFFRHESHHQQGLKVIVEE
jgi:hypothetical protein